jgi:predicted GNAT family N-acyltransferase
MLVGPEGSGKNTFALSVAEALAKENGGERIIVHAQAHARGFYSSLGYSQFGEEDTVEGCAHLWMEKQL